MKKFRDETDEKKLEIINAMIAGDKLERSVNGEQWSEGTKDFVVLDYFYRIPKRPMSIDWSALKDEYICAAMDKRGWAYAYMAMPINDEDVWATALNYMQVDGLKSYDPGTVDWQDSLIWRPGHEPK